MSGHRWNNRFNPPLQTAAPLFSRRAIETPQTPANYTTHQMPGAGYPPIYSDQITRVPTIAITDLSANTEQFTVVATVSFGYRMSGTDRLEFTFTNSNTGVSTTKSYMPENQYTVGEFEPGVIYFVYVTPFINGLYTASSAVQSFLSSPATAPGLLQGVTVTGSGSYAIINFAGVYPTVPFPNFVAVNDNFEDAQVLVSVSAAKRFVIGPYTDGSSYQFTLTPVTASTGGIYRYGTPITVPSGNNYFIPGPPGTPNVTLLSATGKDVAMFLASDISFHPVPVSYQVKTYTSTLSSTIAGIAGVSGDINDLSTSYPAFTVSLGLISSNDYLTLSAAVGSSNLIADITDNTGTWYSFRVTNITQPSTDVVTVVKVYTFSNPYLSKTPLTGTSFSVKFNTLSLSSLIATRSYGAPGIVFPDVQTDTYTTFVTRAFANNVYSLQVEYGTIFAGAPATPANVLQEKGNQTFRWTVGMYGYNLPQSYTSPQSSGGSLVIGGGTGGGSIIFGSQTPIPIGPRPTYYTVRDGAGVVITTISGFVTTISGLTNGQSYNYTITGYANRVDGSPLTALNVVPGYAAPPYSFVSNISNTTVTFRIGRSLGGAFGYVVTAISPTPRFAYMLFLDPGFGDYVTGVFDTGLYADTYQFVVYAQSNSTLDFPNSLGTNVSGSYTLGSPLQPTNLQGVYRGVQNGGITTVNLTLTASWGTGPIVSQYNISDNYGNYYSTPSLPNYDLAYYFTNLSAYRSYSFTVTPFGNSTSGTPVTSQTFNFNPQPPPAADLFMTGSNGGFLNVSFGGATYQYGNPYDYYSISAVRGVFSAGPPAITRIDVASGSPPFQAPATGILYQFAIYNTICGITSSNFTLTLSLTGGPPLPPTVGYTLGCNTVTFSLSVAVSSAVKISNFLVTEYYLDISSGDLLPTGCNYTIPVTPSVRPSVSYTLSGVFTTSYNLVAPGSTWVENPTSTPSFQLIPSVVITDTLALATYPNTVILTLSQNVSSLTFPVNSLVVTNQAASFEAPYYSYTYSSPLLAKPTNIFYTSNALQFTWKSGTGPFTGGSYRYDFQSRGNDTLISTVTSVPINLYVASPGEPTAVTNNTTVTVTFRAPPSTSVPASYFVVSDNYGRTVSGTTTASAYVFTNCTTGSAYSYFATTYAQGISSAPSQPSTNVYPGRPGPPGFQSSFSNLTATLSTTLFPGSVANPYIPITDVCLSVTGTAGYSITRTNLNSSYTTNGPTFGLTNLTIGQTYTFTLSAYANQVYSTIASSCNYYVGSLQPNIPNGATIALSNTTAYISVSASVPGSIPGSLHPDFYVFNMVPVISSYNISTISIKPPFPDTGKDVTGSILTTVGGPVSILMYGGGGGGIDGTPPVYLGSNQTLPGFGGYVQYSLSTSLPVSIEYNVGRAGLTSVQGKNGDGYDSFVRIRSSEFGSNVYTVGAAGGLKQDKVFEYTVSGYLLVDGNPSSPIGFPGTAVFGSVVDTPNGDITNTSLYGNPAYPGWPEVGGSMLLSYPIPATPLPPVIIPYNAASNTYTAVFPGLINQADYTFAGYTITNGLSFGSQWSDPRVFEAGGPRSFTGPISFSLPGGTPVTQNVSLQVVISTGCGGVTGLWADTSYFISISTSAIYSFQPGLSVMTLSSYTTTVSSGNNYIASLFALKNQVNIGLGQNPTFPVPPVVPLTPTISLNSTPNIDAVPGTSIPALVSWVPSVTSNVTYFYSINSGTYVNNGVLTTGAASIPYGTTAILNVYSLINGVSSAPVSSASAYVFANPPTNLTYGRSYNIVSLSWGSAFQPQYSSNITYTASVTGSTTVSGVTIGGGGGGPSVTIGSNLMSAAVYTQITNALSTFRPIVITLSGLGGVTYNASYTVVSSVGVIIQSAIGAYRFGGSGSALPNYTGSNIVFSITNPSSLPTDGYTVRDLCSGSILASNIYSNSYVVTPALGPTYNLAVQALNSNLYSPGGSANTGTFSLATTAVSTLSTTYYSSNVQLSWTTPTQFGGVVPTTTPPYTWTIFDSSGNPAGSSAGSPSTQVIPTIVLPLGGTYRYSIIANYYGISSSLTYGNQITLRTTATSSVTQTTLGAGILVSWQTASQSVYLPESPTVLSTVLPNGGYSLVDLCGHYVGTVNASSEAVQVYIPIPSASPSTYNYYNFAVYAVHNGILSPATAPGAIYLGVNPPTSPTVSLNGMIATLTWNAPATNGPNSPYVIFDSSGSQIGDPSTTGNRTLVYNSPGVYSVTTLITDNVIARAYGAGGGVGAGGFASRTYLNVFPSSTIVVKVGGTGSGGDSSTVYVPNIVSPYLILDAGGGGGFTVSGEGFVRDGVPDGGGIGQAGFGSGGSQAILGGGSPANTNGRVELTMTTQTFSASILTTRTSISFLVNNNTAYNLTIATYSNGLSNSVSVPLTVTVAAPSNLQTTNIGLQLSNVWSTGAGVPGYFITNLATGEYDTVGAVSNSLFPYLGVNGGTYYFAIYSLSGGIPSYQINGVNRVTLFCPSPSNFKSTYNGSTITFSASGNPNSDTAKFVLTDGSGNILQSNLPQSSTGSQVVFAPLFGYAAGQTYNFRLYGVVNGLSSVYVTTSVGIVIPGSTFLGYNPRFEPAGAPAGYTKILVSPMTPYADTYQIISTNLSGAYYSDTADGAKTWVGVAMSITGNTILAASDSTNGSNIWFSTNSGQNWSCNYSSGRVGYAATNVAMAANGTTGAIVTSGGVWVTSNVTTLSPWVYVPAIVNAKAVTISPDGSKIVYVQVSGGIYYGYTSNLAQFSNANGSNILRKWGAITWSGDGSRLVAISADADYGKIIQISTTNGQTWNNLPIESGGGSGQASSSLISMDSNAQTIYWGQGTAIYRGLRQANGNYYIVPAYAMGTNIPYGPPGGEYRIAVSYLGDVVVATNTLSSTVYVSYDEAKTWFVDTRYTQSSVSPGFNGSALSSNGLIECVVGNNSTLQSIINTPVLTPAVVTVSAYAADTYVTVPLGSDGYTIRAYLKNVASEEQYLWTTPQGGPPLWPQTTGPVSLSVPYASGYSTDGSKLLGYILINSNATYSVYSNISYPTGNPGVPDIASYTMTNPTQKAFVFSYANNGNSDLPPGVYQWKIAVSDTSPASSTASISVPLRAPPSLTLAGNGGTYGSSIIANWTSTPKLFTVTYNIYSNGVFQSNAGSVTTTTIPNSGTIPTTIGVEAVYGSSVSTRITASISPPPPPTNLRVTGYSDGTSVNVEWNGTATGYLLSYTGSPGTITYQTTATVPVPVGTSRTIGVAAYVNNLLSTYTYITVTNQTVTRVASGVTTTIAVPYQFIVTSATIIGGGGGGGAGGWGGGPGLQGGGGGGGAGNVTFTAGTGPKQDPGTITLYAGKGGAAGSLGGGGGGGQVSYISIGGNTVAWAGGGGGGGGGNGGAGGTGGRVSGDGGAGGSGGQQGTNNNGGGGGGGGSGAVLTLTGTSSINNGGNGETRVGTPPNATTGGAGGSSYGRTGGGGRATIGVPGKYAGSTGTADNALGCAGGGGGSSSTTSTNPNTSPAGGASADGYITITYSYLTS